ncbi:hypothetical protein [Streptomyces sp. ID05-47C]|uniref:hypothetical protein n=1 Tax=Streptomyces sp. ID05-47C TaxID=3028665 RepID=UPI0029BCFDAC|nr:hypothetical protein [Streptomyces sp. ID05-47C]MDX3570922.1 hypothetical protein [Streptomyces sp. ID05-47C]
MRSMLRITACTAVAVATMAVGAGSASANTLTAGTATTVTVPAVGEAVADLLGTLQGLGGFHREPEWS